MKIKDFEKEYILHKKFYKYIRTASGILCFTDYIILDNKILLVYKYHIIAYIYPRSIKKFLK